MATRHLRRRRRMHYFAPSLCTLSGSSPLVHGSEISFSPVVLDGMQYVRSSFDLLLGCLIFRFMHTHAIPFSSVVLDGMRYVGSALDVLLVLRIFRFIHTLAISFSLISMSRGANTRACGKAPPPAGANFWVLFYERGGRDASRQG